MTRPPGPGYKEFFPAATRAAKNKAMEREKARTKAAGSPADLPGRATPSASYHNDESFGASSRPHRDASVPDIPHHPTDETEFIAGDMLHAVGSASSNESSSSIFSSSAIHQTLGPASKPMSASLTPLTTIDSPTYKYPPHPTKAQSLAPQDTERTNGFVTDGSVAVDGSSTPLPVPPPHVTGRRPIIDPARSVTGVKCTFDPSADPSSSSNPDNRKTKPIFVEFGPVRTHTISYIRGRGWGSVILFTGAFG